MRAEIRQFVIGCALLVAPTLVGAQATWQPAQPPLVTADNEPWYQSGAAILWSGDFYYPAGAQVHFDRYRMARSGSYRGVPLYIDTTLEPYSIVFVPLRGGLMQPYERRRTGELAGTTGSRAPSFPPSIGAEGIDAERPTAAPGIAQAPAEPTRARAYDVAPFGPEPPRPIAPPEPIATTGRTSPLIGRLETAARPTGVNGVWVTYQDRRWFAAGSAVEANSADFAESGTYHGFPVYTRKDDPTAIYIPTAPGLLAPWRER